MNLICVKYLLYLTYFHLYYRILESMIIYVVRIFVDLPLPIVCLYQQRRNTDNGVYSCAGLISDDWRQF